MCALPASAVTARRWLTVYGAAHYLAMPVLLARLALRALRNPAYRGAWLQRFGVVQLPPSSGPRLWLHAVSVGEAQAAAPLVEALQARHGALDVLVTTTTPTGRQRVERLLGTRVTHCYVPYDLPGAVARFLDRTGPQLAVFMETELWPNMLTLCAARGVPVLLVNARLSAHSARGYRRFSRLTAHMLAALQGVAAQTEEDAARLVALGVDVGRVQVTGSVKFDVRVPPSLRERGAALRHSWGAGRGVLLAASTHEGEERVLLEVFQRLLDRLPDTLLVLVPRHPDRFARVVALARRSGLRSVQHSQAPPDCGGVQVYVGDTMGDLPAFYAGADVAFVGGSLVPVGGHNVLEPAALGVPVLTGPHVYNFADITTRLQQHGAARVVQDADELLREATDWLADANARHLAGERGQAFVEANRGALQQVLALIERHLPVSPDARPVSMTRVE